MTTDAQTSTPRLSDAVAPLGLTSTDEMDGMTVVEEELNAAARERLDQQEEEMDTAPPRRTVGPLLDQLEETLVQLLEAGFTPAPGSNVDRLEAIVDAIGKPTPPPQVEEVQDDDPEWDKPKRNRATAFREISEATAFRKISEDLDRHIDGSETRQPEAFDFERELQRNTARQVAEQRSHISQLASAVSLLLHVVAQNMEAKEAFDMGVRAHEIQKILHGGAAMARTRY